MIITKMASEINPKLQIQELCLTDDDFRISTPFSMIVTGPSQSGKSELILKLVKFREKLFSTKFNRIIYCYPSTLASNSSTYIKNLRDEFPNLEIFYGLPDINKLNLNSNRLPCFLIIDDLMTEFLNSEEMTHLITKQVHHLNISVCATLQNYFAPSKFGKTIIRNSQLKFIIYNPAEAIELSKISLQLASDAHFLAESFKVLNEYYPTVYSHYILHDGHFQSKLKSARFRTNIFPFNDKIKPIFFPKIIMYFLIYKVNFISKFIRNSTLSLSRKYYFAILLSRFPKNITSQFYALAFTKILLSL